MIPSKIPLRSKTVEHPFGTIKAWMGATHFKMKTLKHVATEMALHVLAYNHDARDGDPRRAGAGQGDLGPAWVSLAPATMTEPTVLTQPPEEADTRMHLVEQRSKADPHGRSPPVSGLGRATPQAMCGHHTALDRLALVLKGLSRKVGLIPQASSICSYVRVLVTS